MININTYNFVVSHCTIFNNPNKDNKEYIIITLFDPTLSPLDRNILTVFDVYEGNDNLHTFVKDMLSTKSFFPIVTMEGVIYGYGKRFNIARYLGIAE